MKYYLPSVTSVTEIYLIITRFLLGHMFANYNKGKQHFLSFTFNKIMFSPKAFLKKKTAKKNTAILNSQYFVTSVQSTAWQKNVTFSFLESLTGLKCKTQTLACHRFHFNHFRVR